MIPKQSHPMDIVRTGVSWLGMEEPDTLHMDHAPHANSPR